MVKEINTSIFKVRPIPEAAPFKVWICGRSLARVAGSNPAGRMDVPLLRVL
jgi:hypothetical protein